MYLSIQEEMPSGPEEVLGGRFEMRKIMSLSEHRSGLGLDAPFAHVCGRAVYTL